MPAPLPPWGSAWPGFSDTLAVPLLLSETTGVVEGDGRTIAESLIASETKATKIDG